MVLTNTTPNAIVPSTAVVFSLGGSIGMMLKELIRSYGIKIANTVNSVDELIHTVKTGGCDCVLIDDSSDYPSFMVLRRLVSDPVTMLVPKLVFMGDPHPTSEKDMIPRLPMIQTLTKPLTPAKFHPVMKNVVLQLRNEPYTTLRAVSRALIEGKTDIAVKVLTKLMSSPVIGELAAQALAAHLYSLGQLNASEKLLLALVKRNPRNAITMFQLIDLYYGVAMPRHGLRIALGLRQACPTSVMVLPDVIQGHLLLNDFEQLHKVLLELHTSGSMTEPTRDFLFRVLSSEGRMEEAMRYLSTQREKDDLPPLIEKAWADPGDNQTPSPAR